MALALLAVTCRVVQDGRLLPSRSMPRSAVALAEPSLRIGHGYDIHRLASREEAGQPIVMGGVRFDGTTAPDNELGIVAHSDGDVIYHSVVDAILGALTMPDIGQLFPDNDPRLKSADSEVFMEEAYARMRSRGYAVGNVDVTLICQTPRVNVRLCLLPLPPGHTMHTMAPYGALHCASVHDVHLLRSQVEHAGKQCKQLMIDNLGRLLRTEPGRVNVKARTHEKVDAVGECRAVECHVVLTLERDLELLAPSEPVVV